MTASPNIRKLMLLGKEGAGKSSIARRLVFNEFVGTYSATIGSKIHQYELEPPLAEGPFHYLIWDTDGTLGHDALSDFHVKQSSAAFVVGDVSHPASIEAMLAIADAYVDQRPGRFVAYVLNKIDLTGDAPPADIVARIAPTRRPIYAMSAKTGQDVALGFRAAASAILAFERSLA